MRLNRIILAISCGAGLALVGACADGSHLTSPANRVPVAKATVGDTFCCGTNAQLRAAPIDTFAKHGN